jgi:hypothetical protein
MSEKCGNGRAVRSDDHSVISTFCRAPINLSNTALDIQEGSSVVRIHHRI